ncbi:sigma-70 family RNA polymerase sigma factor [Martelella sp. UBA3392]|uniref:sigma-70 family RNA polymerase sigma factor n=1 Tax=Martelella sp. UBA3392 TaxID=1946834 RepID=UPI0031F4B493
MLTDHGRAATTAFEKHRPLLKRIAYRMLGSHADAEDMVQEAFIRWMKADHAAIRSDEAFLRRMVSRLCLDQLKSARAQRETYIGPWLPAPAIEEEPEVDFTLPLMLALERLSPLERAAFLLHDVFGMDFAAVGDALERSPQTCRQLAARARDHVREEAPRFPVEHQMGLDVARAFHAASRSGDIAALRDMLVADASFHADGGGKRSAAFRVVSGVEDIITIHERLAEIAWTQHTELVRLCYVNGLPGFVTREADGELQVTALLPRDGKIAAIYVIRNPDKLRHLDAPMMH